MIDESPVGTKWFPVGKRGVFEAMVRFLPKEGTSPWFGTNGKLWPWGSDRDEVTYLAKDFPTNHLTRIDQIWRGTCSKVRK